MSYKRDTFEGKYINMTIRLLNQLCYKHIIPTHVIGSLSYSLFSEDHFSRSLIASIWRQRRSRDQTWQVCSVFET